MRTIYCLVALVALLATSVSPARADTTLVVTTTIDGVDNNPGDGVCETAPSNGTCTLRAAIQEANVLEGMDTIQLPAGTYGLSLPAIEPDMAGGDLDITSPLTLTGTGPSSTIIDANGIDRVLQIQARGNVVIIGVTLQHGVTTNGDGAGIHIGRGHVELHDSVVTNNQNLSPYYQSNGGGGINNFGRLELFNTTVSNNYSSSRGGGIVNAERLRMVNSTLSGNTASMYGGGLYNVGTIATLRNTTVRENNAALEGGGIMNHYETPTLEIIKSTIVGNTANKGGGLINYANATLTNVTVSGNTADSYGGGIYNASGQINTPFLLANTTVANNEALYGAGGVLFSTTGPAVIQNSILAGNHVADGPSVDCSGTVISQGYNLIQQPADCTINGDLTGVLTEVDPLLGPLQANDGATDTHALLPQSPAIDAGNPSGCLDAAGLLLETDQRGVKRPKDGDRDGQARCDMGAYERKPRENTGN
jgi:CSLREA domain-containing protein